LRSALAVGLALALVVTALAPVGVAAAQESEPNDSREQAQDVETGEERTGETTSSGGADYYAFTAEAGEIITVSAYASADNGADTQVELLRADGTQVASTPNLAGKRGRMGTTAPYSGTYYVRFAPYFGATGASYDFTVETTAGESFEPNEDSGNATALTDEQEVDGTLTIGDADWFRFTADSGDNITLTTYASGGTGNATNVVLRHQNGSAVASLSDLGGQQRTLTHVANDSGTYYVEVVPRFADFYGATYNLTVDLPGEPPTGETESGGTDDGGGDGGGVPLLLIVAVVVVALAAGVGYWRTQT
jgi:hypothetical protein